MRADLQRLNKEILSDAEIAKRAEAELIRKANKEKIDAAVRAAEAQKIAAREAAVEAVRAAKEAAREQEKAARDAEKAVTATARAEARERLKEAKAEAAAARQLAREKVAASKAAAKEVAAAEKERAAAANEAAEAETKQFAATESSILNAVKAVGSFTAGMIGLSGASQIATVVIDHFKQINKSIYEAVEFVERYRKALLDLAALKGQLGNTTKTLGQDLDFRSKTLQSKEDAIAFQKAGLGVGQSAVDAGLISQDEFRKAMEYGGAFQAVEGGDAATHATLIGLIPQLLGRKTTGAEVAQKEKQLYNIFQPGGTDFSPLGAQYAKMAPLISSRTYDMMQGAALLSAFSTTNREAPFTEVDQFTRATIGNVDRTGKPRIKDASPVGKYYDSLGINKEFLRKTKSTDLAFAIGNKVADDLKSQASKDSAMGVEENQLLYLQHKGFGNLEDRKALLHYAGLKNSGIFDKSFFPLAADSALPSLEEATRPVKQAQNREPVMQARKVELADEAAKIAIGAGKQALLMNLEGVAFNRLKAKGEVSGNFDEDLFNRWNTDPREITNHYRHKMDLEAQKMLVAEAERLGIPTPGVWNIGQGGTRFQTFAGRDNLYELGRQIHAKGGTAVPGLDEVVGRAQSTLKGAAAFEGQDGEAGAGAPAAAAAPAADMTETNHLLRQIVKGVVPGAPRPLVPPNYVMRR